MIKSLRQLQRLRALRESRALAQFAEARGELAQAEQRLEVAREAHNDARAELPKARDAALAELMQGAATRGAQAYVALRYRIADETRALAAAAERTSAEAAQARRRDAETRNEEWRLKRRDVIKLAALGERTSKLVR